MRHPLLFAIAVLLWLDPLAIFAQETIRFSDYPVEQAQNNSWSELQAELAFNEGLLQYQMGDYDGAYHSMEPWRQSNPLAAQVCEHCDVAVAGGSSFFAATNENIDDRETRWHQRYRSNPVNRRWNFTVLTGYQYDSNVSLSPNFVGLGSVTEKNDSSWYVASFGDYRLVQESDFNVGLIMSQYANWYFEQTNFNLQDYMGGAYVNRVLTENTIAGIRYEFHKTLLNDNSFSSEHRIVPNISLLRGNSGHTTAFYEFDSINFDDEPLIPALDPSAHVHAVGLTQAWYTFCGTGRMYAGYRFENATADGSDFDRDSHQVNARIEVPVDQDFICDAGIRYFWDNYDNANSLDFWGNSRDDERLELRTGLQFIHNRHLSSRVDYTYIDSDSNVSNLFGVRFFDYSRHNLTAQLIYDF